MPTQPLPPKKDVALALLERTSVFVHLDPRVAAVVVPPAFKKQAQLVLQVGLNMPVPIRDLHLDDEGMTCTLSFNRTPFFCVVPWSSVYAVVGCDDGRGMIWPDDVPPEVAQAQGRPVDGSAARAPREAPKVVPAPAPQAEASRAKRPRKRPVLGAVPAPARESTPEAAQRVQRSNGPPHEPEQREQRDERPAASAASSPLRARAAEATGRRKRELPPYLRVVK